MAAHCCHDFLGVDIGYFFARITFLCAVWLGILAGNQRENMCLYSWKSIWGDDTHTWNTSQSSRWIKTHSGIKPWQQNNSPATRRKNILNPIVLYRTVLYCIKHGFQQRRIKHRFGAIHLFYELIIHDHLESRAMNITDDTHEAIYQSAGNRWTRLEERCTVYHHCILCC